MMKSFLVLPVRTRVTKTPNYVNQRTVALVFCCEVFSIILMFDDDTK